MEKKLENIIHRYTNGLLETQNLQIIDENFSNENIHNEYLFSSTFKNSSLLNLNFTKVNFESSFFQKCVFDNCVFDLSSFSDSEFQNCILRNCQIMNCNLSQIEFTETTFEKCCFERIEKGSLVKGWFESCHFIDTNFKGFEGISLIQTAVVDSKFSKFDKSIKFEGEFFLTDVLYSKNGIYGMFLE